MYPEWLADMDGETEELYDVDKLGAQAIEADSDFTSQKYTSYILSGMEQSSLKCSPGNAACIDYTDTVRCRTTILQ